MAEIIGTAVAIGGLVEAGVKLSTALFEFAGKLDSAGAEIRMIASDVVLFCQVLDQIASTVTQGSKLFRLPETAVQTTEQIVERCRGVFDTIRQIILSLDSGDQRSPIERMARVRWTLRDRKRVVLLQESLKGCSTHLQLMVQCMTLAQTFPMPTASPEDRVELEKKQEYHRSLTCNLILAQQAVNDRIEELEDECSLSTPEANGISNTNLAPPSEASVGMLSPPDSPGRPRHRRNRSSQILHGIVYSPPKVNSMLEIRRLSAFLNYSLYQENVSRESRRDSWASVSDHRQSAVLCDTLMRTWIDQIDPLLNEARDTDADQDLTPCQSPRIPNVVVDKVRESMALDDLETMSQAFGTSTLEIVKSTNKTVSMPPVSALPEAFRMFDIIEYGREYVPYVIWHDQDSWIRLDEISLSELVQRETTGQKPLFMLRRLRPASMLFPMKKPPEHQADNAAFAEPLSSSTKLIDRENEAEMNIKAPQNITPSNSELLPENLSVTQDSLSSSLERADIPTAGATPTEIFKTIRLGLEVPCWKIIPVAVKKYNIDSDWRNYSLWVICGDQERCVGLHEKPLVVFRDLIREGNKPIFKLKKWHSGSSLQASEAGISLMQLGDPSPDEDFDMSSSNSIHVSTPSSNVSATRDDEEAVVVQYKLDHTEVQEDLLHEELQVAGPAASQAKIESLSEQPARLASKEHSSLLQDPQNPTINEPSDISLRVSPFADGLGICIPSDPPVSQESTVNTMGV